MGRKYASIHVYGKEQEKVLLALENNCNNSAKDLEEEIWEMVRQKYKDNIPESFQKLLKYKNPSKIILTKSDVFLSIYDESDSFETIQDRVKKLSSIIDSPVLYTSNFDDDVFLIGAYKSGKLITSGKMGDGLSEYGMKPKKISIDKLCKTFQLERTEALGAINSMDEIDEIEQAVEEYLHIPLDLDLDSVESDTSYVETLSNNRFHVFNKK